MLDHPPKGAALADQRLLSDELGEVSRPDARRERGTVVKAGRWQ